jgi:Sulfotransferase domain
MMKTNSIRNIFSILLLVLVVVVRAAENPSILDMLPLLFKPKNKEIPVTPPQRISVIGAGQGRTGTSSLLAALARLGFKSYHMFDGVLETPGHLDLWHSFYHQKSITMDQVLDRIEADGFNATVDAPTNFHFERQLARNPEAKVILSLRKGGGASWATSMHESVLLFHPLLRRVPFRWIPRMIKQGQFFAQMNRELGVPVVDEETQIPQQEYMAAYYDKWTEHVKATIPNKDQLLIFYAQDGWEPLCRFLSPLSDEVQAKCQEVLESGDPYPHLNDKDHIQRIVSIFGTICAVFESFPALVALYLIIRLIRSTSRSRTGINAAAGKKAKSS